MRKIIIALLSIAFLSCQSEWVVLKLENEVFVSFPAQPGYKETTDSSEYGSYAKKVYTLLPSNDADENLVYQLSMHDMPLAYNLSTQKTYESFIRQEVDLLGGRLISQRLITVNGAEACEAIIDFRNGEYRVKCRLLIHGRKIYNIGVATKKDKLFNLNINKFLNSFTFM